ncbi:MAG: AroM family protein [Alphaproteobacteria bacterium]|nr:AroM family protein [Alphaproteobacteria bacterium]
MQTQRDVDHIVPPLCRLIEREGNHTDAFVIACFSDPGLHSARETTDRPVFGIMESGVTAALALGNAVGIIAILPSSVARHTRQFRAMGLSQRIAAERPVGLNVVDLLDEDKTYTRLVATGKALRDEDGADVVVMGCAGMARYRDRMEQVLGIPVVEPSQAAAGMAITAIRLGWRTGRRAA